MGDPSTAVAASAASAADAPRGAAFEPHSRPRPRDRARAPARAPARSPAATADTAAPASSRGSSPGRRAPGAPAGPPPSPAAPLPRRPAARRSRSRAPTRPRAQPARTRAERCERCGLEWLGHAASEGRTSPGVVAGPRDRPPRRIVADAPQGYRRPACGGAAASPTEWVRWCTERSVDVDLERFFDRVKHDALMARVARRIGDRRILRLIRRYLDAGVMVGGVTLATDGGHPARVAAIAAAVEHHARRPRPRAGAAGPPVRPLCRRHPGLRGSERAARGCWTASRPSWSDGSICEVNQDKSGIAPATVRGCSVSASFAMVRAGARQARAQAEGSAACPTTRDHRRHRSIAMPVRIALLNQFLAAGWPTSAGRHAVGVQRARRVAAASVAAGPLEGVEAVRRAAPQPACARHPRRRPPVGGSRKGYWRIAGSAPPTGAAQPYWDELGLTARRPACRLRNHLTNRRMRARMSGGVRGAGADADPYPIPGDGGTAGVEQRLDELGALRA